MKIAHLILAHTNAGQLKRLAERLQHPQADVYIHLDLKTDIKPYLSLKDIPGVRFISNRIKVYWGGFSIVEATLNSFEEILNTNIPYQHINLISGQHYPIKSADAVCHFFAQHAGKTFMHYESITDEWLEALPRIRKYHFVSLNFTKGKYRLEQLANSILPERKLPDGIVAVGRSQWFAASREAIAYMLDYARNKKWAMRFFKYSWAADEIFFQTILYNSPLRSQMVNDNLLYVDWSARLPNPKILTMADAPALKSSDKLFARKFDPDTDAGILDYIDNIVA